MCASNPYPRELPKTQTTSPLAARFQCFSPRWSAFWVPRSSGRPLDGGNCTTRGCDTPATRRKRASCSAKPPPATVVERTCGSGRPRPSAHEREKPSNRTQGRPTSGTKLSQHTPSHRMCGTKLSQHTPSHRMCGTKLSQHTPSHRMCGTKLSQHEPHGPTSGRKLSLFTRNGSIWRFFYMQGEFCTVVTAKKLSRENFVPNAGQSWGSPTGHQAPPAWRVPEGPVWRARAGFEAQPGRGAGGRWWSPAAVSTNNSSTQPKQISHAIPPRHGSMHAQKPQNINDQTSTLEIHSGELHAKLPKSSQDLVWSGFVGRVF